LHPLRAVGQLRPDRRAEADIEKGLAAVARLAPFETGEAVVVARSYILAIAAAEPTLAMLERTRALRQWGIGAKRRIGVLALRASGRDVAQLETLLDRSAAQGLAGVAIIGPPASQAAFEKAGGLADQHGLFLVIRGEDP
jgi:DUF1009 family protein